MQLLYVPPDNQVCFTQKTGRDSVPEGVNSKDFYHKNMIFEE